MFQNKRLQQELWQLLRKSPLQVQNDIQQSIVYTKTEVLVQRACNVSKQTPTRALATDEKKPIAGLERYPAEHSVPSLRCLFREHAMFQNKSHKSFGN